MAVHFCPGAHKSDIGRVGVKKGQSPQSFLFSSYNWGAMYYTGLWCTFNIHPVLFFFPSDKSDGIFIF